MEQNIRIYYGSRLRNIGHNCMWTIKYIYSDFKVCRILLNIQSLIIAVVRWK